MDFNMGTMFWFWVVMINLAYIGATGNDTDGTSIINGTDEARNSNAIYEPNFTTGTDGTSKTNGMDEANKVNGMSETSNINGTYEYSKAFVRLKADVGYTSESTDTQEDSYISDDVSDTKNTAEHLYSDKFIMKTSLTQKEVEHIATRNGFELKKRVMDGFYLLKRKTTVPRMSKKPIRLSANTTLKKHPMIESFEQEKYLKRYKRQFKTEGNKGSWLQSLSHGAIRSRRSPVINDDHWRYMWYLHNNTRPSMGIYEAWSRGYTGKGVVIAFLDDGVQTTHRDLATNYRSDLSYNYIFDRYSPEHSYADDGHGTSCAGIVSAVKNNYCVLGIAYNSNFAALKILDENFSNTDSDEAMAFTHYNYEIEIFSNSWGPSDDGDIFGGPDSLAKKAISTGVFEGRGGKGSIFVFASGNGRKHDDDCNCDGYSNSVYTIAISSLSDTGNPAYYAEPCTAVLATTYGGDYPNPMIVTTNRSSSCTKEFQGTSASAPVATGIIALTLEANPDLTWRDIQHIIVETSSNKGLKDPEGFTYNAAGKKVSRYHGFGLMNANAMITKALTWESVPKRFYVSTELIYPYTSTGFSLSSTVRLRTNIKYIEQVTVTIYFRLRTRGHAVFHLTSPSGTRSKILGARRLDTTYMFNVGYFTFSSVHTWGEDPSGIWELEMDSSSLSYETVELNKWQLRVYGTLTDPLRGTPAAGLYGGDCLYGKKCSASEHCCDNELDICDYRNTASCYDTDKTTTNPWALFGSKLSSSSSSLVSSSSAIFTSNRTDYWLDGDDSGATNCHIRSDIMLILTGFIIHVLSF